MRANIPVLMNATHEEDVTVSEPEKRESVPLRVAGIAVVGFLIMIGGLTLKESWCGPPSAPVPGPDLAASPVTHQLDVVGSAEIKLRAQEQQIAELYRIVEEMDFRLKVIESPRR